MGQCFLKTVCSEESGHFITLEKKAKNLPSPFCTSHTHLYKILRLPIQYSHRKHSVQREGTKKENFHNSSHQVSEKNSVLYRAHKSPYRILHQLESRSCIWQDCSLLYLLFPFRVVFDTQIF